MQELRQYLRASSEALVEMSHPSFGMIELRAKDLSDGGIYVFLGTHTAPPVGTVVKVRIKRHTGLINQQPVDMQVVHQHAGGMGLKFI